MTESANSKKDKKFNNRSNWYKSPKKQTLEVGIRGFLATCNYREKDCVRECYNILNHYADQLYGPSNAVKEASKEDKPEEPDETDIADDLQKEIDAAKAASKPGTGCRFNSIDTGAKNCIFIKTTLPDPVELHMKIIKDIAETKVKKTRYLLRFTPIQVVCQANVDEIIKASGALFDKYFLKEGKTFAIVFNRRLNNDIKRDEIIKILADLVFDKNVKNKVDLKNAELAVIIEIIKGKCCLSVVEDYFKYRKYNLFELASNKSEDKKSDEIKPKDDDINEELKPHQNEEGSETDEPSAKKIKSSMADNSVDESEKQTE